MRVAIVLLISSLGIAAIKPFSLPQMNPQGPLYQSSDHPDSVFVIENYFIDCPYCNDNAENVDALAEEYKENARVQVLDVGIDRTVAQYEEWIRRHNPNHPVLNDGARKLTRQLGTSHYPTAYVVNSSGEVLLKTTGVWSTATKAKIRGAIETALESARGEGVRDIETSNDGR